MENRCCSCELRRDLLAEGGAGGADPEPAGVAGLRRHHGEGVGRQQPQGAPPPSAPRNFFESHRPAWFERASALTFRSGPREDIRHGRADGHGPRRRALR